MYSKQDAISLATYMKLVYLSLGTNIVTKHPGVVILAIYVYLVQS